VFPSLKQKGARDLFVIKVCPTSNAIHELIDGFPIGDVPQSEEERLEVVFFLFGVEVFNITQHVVPSLLA